MQNTDRRSALRITRESELLGGQLTAYHTREALVVEAAFLRDDLPYFTELLGEVITKTRYTSTLDVPHAVMMEMGGESLTNVFVSSPRVPRGD